MKCPSCEAEFTPPKGKSVANCPFCGEALIKPAAAKGCGTLAEALAFIAASYGGDILLHGQRLTAFLSDIYPKGKAERNVLNSAFSLDIPARLAAAGEKPAAERQVVLTRCAKQLEDNYFIAVDAAAETLWALAEALGWEREPARQAKPASEPPKPAPMPARPAVREAPKPVPKPAKTETELPDKILTKEEAKKLPMENGHVSIPYGYTEIATDAFRFNTAATAITIPDSVRRMGEHVFMDSSLKTARLPEGLKVLPRNIFRKCNRLVDVQIPAGVREIAITAFAGCSALQELSIPSSVSKIGYEAFQGCTALKKLRIPGRVREIGKYTFWDCHALTELYLPRNVQEIGEGAFKGCDNLTVTCPRDSYAYEFCEENDIPVQAGSGL